MNKRLKPIPHFILHFLVIISLLGVFYFSYVLYQDNTEYVNADESYQELRQSIQGDENQNKIIAFYDFDELKEINPDVVGWILSKGSEINYPLVQAEDNDYYLNHLFTKEQNKLGSIFMDYRNQSDFSDQNTIIYGHNMKDGSMFSSLTKYKDQSYYEEYPSMIIYTPNGDFKIELFAGVIVNGDYETIHTNFSSNQDFKNLIYMLKKNSTFQSNIDVKMDSKIVTFSTCTYEFENARYALFGLLTPLSGS